MSECAEANSLAAFYLACPLNSSEALNTLVFPDRTGRCGRRWSLWRRHGRRRPPTLGSWLACSTSTSASTAAPRCAAPSPRSACSGRYSSLERLSLFNHLSSSQNIQGPCPLRYVRACIRVNTACSIDRSAARLHAIINTCSLHIIALLPCLRSRFLTHAALVGAGEEDKAGAAELPRLRRQGRHLAAVPQPPHTQAASRPLPCARGLPLLNCVLDLHRFALGCGGSKIDVNVLLLGLRIGGLMP